MTAFINPESDSKERLYGSIVPLAKAPRVINGVDLWYEARAIIHRKEGFATEFLPTKYGDSFWNEGIPIEYTGVTKIPVEKVGVAWGAYLVIDPPIGWEFDKFYDSFYTRRHLIQGDTLIITTRIWLKIR